MKIYGAYGSNLNRRQMQHRVPQAKAIGTAVLNDWKLCLKGQPGRTYLSVEPAAGQSVLLGLWQIDDNEEAALDVYEDYPSLYQKRTNEVAARLFDGTSEILEVLFYYMDPAVPYNLPSNTYWQECIQGFLDFGFPLDPLQNALYESIQQIHPKRTAEAKELD